MQTIAAVALHGDYRQLQLTGKLIQVHMHAASACYIDHVGHQHQRELQLQQLSRQVEVALQITGVQHIHHQIGSLVH